MAVRQRTRAWKGLAWGLAAFAGLQAAFQTAVASGWVRVTDHVYDDKVALLARHGDAFVADAGPDRRPALLVIGSSRTMGGVDAERLGHNLDVVAFNFGTPAAGPVMNNLYLRRLLRDGYRPDFLVVEVLPPFLAGQVHPPMGSRWIHPHRIRDDEIGRLAAWDCAPARDDPSPLPDWFGGSSLHRTAFLIQALPRWVPYDQVSDARSMTDAYGWARLPHDTITPEQYRKGLSNAWRQYRQALDGFECGGGNCAALRDLLEVCRRENVPVALLLMPEAGDFRSWYSQEALRQVDAFLSGLRDEFSVPVIDARRWVPDGEFADGHHLLTAGARRFTDRLAAELRALPAFADKEARVPVEEQHP